MSKSRRLFRGGDGCERKGSVQGNAGQWHKVRRDLRYPYDRLGTSVLECVAYFYLERKGECQTLKWYCGMTRSGDSHC